MGILGWIKGIAVGLGVGLLIGAIGGFKICEGGYAKALFGETKKEVKAVIESTDKSAKTEKRYDVNKRKAREIRSKGKCDYLDGPQPAAYSDSLRRAFRIQR